MFNPIRHEEDMIKDSVKAELARKVLEATLHAIDNRLDPETLEKLHLEDALKARREKERRKSLIKTILGGSFLAVAGAGFVAALIHEVKSGKEMKAAIQEEQQKELYRKLSTIKGK